MASLNPFLSSPQEWVEELAKLKSEREKIERREDHLRDKLKAHMAEKQVDHVESPTHVVRYESRERIDTSQKALEAVCGEHWQALKDSLPRVQSQALVLRERKDDVAAERIHEVEDFFAKQKKEAK